MPRFELFSAENYHKMKYKKFTINIGNYYLRCVFYFKCGLQLFILDKKFNEYARGIYIAIDIKMYSNK
jgi:hypothetical protein